LGEASDKTRCGTLSEDGAEGDEVGGAERVKSATSERSLSGKSGSMARAKEMIASTASRSDIERPDTDEALAEVREALPVLLEEVET
jgi:hypothetical protein